MQSDDFATGTLDTAWTVTAPPGATASLSSDLSDAYLELATPDGSYDAWKTNGTVRAMQTVANGDFQIETRFLSTPTGMYQMQGFLVEQDENTWLRFDTYSDGSKLYAFGAITTGGTSTAQFNVALPLVSAPYLRLTRTGDTWTFEYSADGDVWTIAGTFDFALTIGSAGVFAGNTGPATGYTAKVDYFENTSAPITNEDGGFTPPNVAPQAGDDTVGAEVDTDLVIGLAELLANDVDGNGDTLSVTSVGQPAHGTITDNGDGSLTYTPAPGFSGTDSFSYTVSDGSLSDTATVAVLVAKSSGEAKSDDFSGSTLDPIWVIDGPAGVSVDLGATINDAVLELATPTGDYDVWKTNNGARAVQAISDSDFQIETRFVTTPSEKYQMQGILVEQDADNWLRFDTYSDGRKLYAFAAITVDGNSTALINTPVPGNNAPYLRVSRSGDLWQFEYSTDGIEWVTAGSFTHHLNVATAGVFAGSTAQANGFVAQVDYFENTAAPLSSEDGVASPPNEAPSAVDDEFQTTTETALQIALADLLANDTDPNGDALQVSSFSGPGHGSLADNGDGTFTYTPDPGFSGEDNFSYTASDGELSSQATVRIAVEVPPPPPAAAQSDDFSGGVLGPVWQIVSPAGTSTEVATTIDEAFLILATPDGNHDIWKANNAVRAMQTVLDEDFQLEVGFLTTPTEKYQMQGLLIEQDTENWIRFDTYSNGAKLYAFAAVTLNGSSSARINIQIDGGTAPFLRVTRSGDTWQFEYSDDGQIWTTAGSFTHALSVTSAGVFAGNIGQADGYVARVDYFENTANPIGNEDGTIVQVNTPPMAAGDDFYAEMDTDLIIGLADLFANDIDHNGDTLSLAGFTQPGQGGLVDNGDGTLTYTPAPGFAGVDSFTYNVTDGQETSTATVVVTVSPAIPPAVSDDFAGETLGTDWTIVAPVGASANVSADVTDAFLELVTPDGDHDVWHTNNAIRAMQEIPDKDLQFEVRFLSKPTSKYQMQGLLFEQDADNWVRFDTYSNGSKLYAFAAVTVAGQSSVQINMAVPGNDASYLRVTRDGDQWTLEFSADGVSWTTAGSFSHDLHPTAAGVFAGNTGQASGFTAQVDYFQNNASPLQSEDGTFVPENVAPEAGDDNLFTTADLPIIIYVTDLLANDLDANGDPLNLAGFTSPVNGVLVDNGNGTLTYTPYPGYDGIDSFTYDVSDGQQSDSAIVTIAVSPPPAPAISDDFSQGTIDPVWRVEGPTGTSGHLATTADDAFLMLVTPDGDHDVWHANKGARALQSVIDEDFQIAARFLTTPTQSYQMQGLLVEQDSDIWIRFDTVARDTGLHAFAAVTVAGKSTTKVNVAIPGNEAPFLRVTRTGDDWQLDYSTDGQTWITAGQFTFTMTASSVGVFAGNTGLAKGFTARVDYFENTATPILSEDESFTPINIAPVAQDDSLVTPVDSALTIDVAGDLLANDSDVNFDTLTVVNVTAAAHGSLVDNGNGTLTYTPSAGFGGSDGFTYTISDGTTTDTASVSLFVGNPIDVWYGLDQTFGLPGEGQEWINILGNVAGDIASLTYSLNGGPERALSVGADTRRLQSEGDFNIDIGFAELDPTLSDDVVTITATFSNGAVQTRDVTVRYEDETNWDPNYEIAWNSVTNVQDVAQVVDGTWAIGPDGVRPVDLGYDRLLVVGDSAWDNYEARLSVTAHNLNNVDPLGRDGGAFAIGMLWNGHTDEPIHNWQPKSGWEPGAAFFVTHNHYKAHSYHDFNEVLGATPHSLVEGNIYNVVVRVEQVGLYDRVYSLKVWEDGAPEPAGWTIQSTETFDINEAPATGSLYLNAHYFDVSFGDLTVTEIAGDDIVRGTDGEDRLSAIDAQAPLPGSSEVDVFVGDAGADEFVFGDANGAYYDDGDVLTPGEDDFGFIWDFVSGVDRIALAGTASDYVLGPTTGSQPAGTAIYLRKPDGEPSELIAVINSEASLSLNGPDFVFTELIA